MQVATGISILHGIALGKIRIFKHPEYIIDEKLVDDPIPELGRFEQARCKVQEQQQVLYDRAVAAAGEESAAIFQFHADMLDDDDLLYACKTIMVEQHHTAEYAAKQGFENVAQMFKEMEDPYFQARSADVIDVGNAVIEDYRSEYDPGDHFQFAVTMLRLDSGIHIVTFRGSDDSTAGWKEDFLISFTKTMAQRRALAYLMDVIPDRGAAGAADPSKPKIYFGPGAEPKPRADSFIICGHSKGGNLALYACPQLTDNQLSHVRHIYICDAPGLSPDEFPDIHPERIDAITTNILPEYSIFGRLFEPALNNTEIVRSTADGVLQHAPESWIVTPGGGLSIAGKFDVSSGWINDTMEQWLESVSSEDRLAFVNQLFGTIEADGCSKMTDFIGESPLALENLVSAVLESDDRSRRFALKRPFTRLKSGMQSGVKKTEKRTADDVMYEPDFRAGLLLAVIGAVLLLIPSAYADALVVVLFAVLVAAEYVTLILRLRSRKWNLAGERMRVIICTVLTVFFLFTVVKSGSLYLPGDILFCSWFLISAYVSAAELHTHKKSMHPARKLLRAAEAVVFAVFGVAVLVLPAGTVGRYSFWAGVLLAGDGLLRMVESLLVQRALERMLR